MPLPQVCEILPLHGVGPVHLGMTPEAVQQIFQTKPEVAKKLARRHIHLVEAYHKQRWQIHYDASGLAKYIRVYYDPRTIFLYEGRDIFRVPHTEALNMILEDAAYDKIQSRPGAVYVFPRLEMSIELSPPLADRAQFLQLPILSFGIAQRGYFS